MKRNKLFKKAITIFISLQMAYKAFQAKKKYDLKLGDSDTENAVDSMYKAQPLYKSLIVKTHPDRYIDPESKNLMEELSRRITRHKYNYAMLKELELEFNRIKL